jgi:hypothetical protein
MVACRPLSLDAVMMEWDMNYGFFFVYTDELLDATLFGAIGALFWHRELLHHLITFICFGQGSKMRGALMASALVVLEFEFVDW